MSETCIDLGTHRLHYTVTGQGPSIVLVHGFADTLHLWDEQVDDLASKYRVVRYDQRGHGQSSAPPGPYTMNDLADDLLGVLDGLGIDRACIVGHSMGGRTLFQFALTHPERIRALVPVGAQSEAPREPYRTTLVGLRTLLLQHGVGAFFDQFVLAGEASERLLADPIRGPVYRQRFLDNRVDVLVACMDAILGMETLTNRLSEIRAATLAVVGEGDHAFRELADRYAREMPRCRTVVIPDVSHCPPLDAPPDFNAAVREFLDTFGDES